LRIKKVHTYTPRSALVKFLHDQKGNVMPFSRNGLLERLDGVRRVRPDGIVRMDLCISNHLDLINDLPARHGQGPGTITVMFLKIDAKLRVDLLQVFREFENQAIFLGHAIARVTQKLHAKPLLLNKGAGVLFFLGGNHD
jgi:hypothetical protein